MARKIQTAGRRAVILSGGELTVTIRGKGRGGPNQEYALALIPALAGTTGIAALAVLPALGEEILFRGALQPRLGLIATALLFTASHSEYGFSLDILSVLVAAFGLGLLRKFANTTTSAISHAAYNLAVGVGVAASQVDAAGAIELVLVAVAAYAIWSRWHRRADASEPPLTGRVVEQEKIE